MRKLMLAVAGVVFAGSVAAAKAPAVSMELAHNSAVEQQVKDLMLAGFVHEQIHWFLAGKGRDLSKAIADAAQRYPNAPESLADGGAGSRSSTTLHLVVCQLEFESLRALLGADAATAVVQEQITEGASGLGYQWIYQKVLDDQDQLSRLIRTHKLTLRGMP